MREQVCVYMCPWPRIQAALTDEWALNVTYKYDRGEARTSLKKANELRALGEPVGDCIDCYQCVAVCPTGIDIRNGSQLDCIQCGLCIDACDAVMTKIGRETRLIGYDNDINIHRREAGKPPIYRIVRPRTITYAAMIAAVGAIMLYALLTRTLLDINVLHDRNPVAVKLSDGSIRNAYTVRLLNKRGFDRVIAIDVDGPVNADTPCRRRRFRDAGSADDRPGARHDHRVAASGDGTGGKQSREIHSSAFSRHRHRTGRGRLRHGSFRVAMKSERSVHMSRTQSPKPLTGGKVLLILVAFFGVVIGVNMVMMRFAIQTLPGTEVDSAYSASLAYEKEIATARDQSARNWKVDAHVERSGQGGATLQVEARDSFGRPMSGLKFHGRFERPTDRRADLPVALAEVGIGIYRGSADAVAPGQWDLVLEGVAAGQRLFLSRNRVLLN